MTAESFAASLPALCGLGLYGDGGDDWLRFGGYTYLHLPLPMYWPKDGPDLAAAAPAFNTLLYTIAPPPELGFTALQCFGRVCVAQRPGRCDARPMAAMPFPTSLADLAPPKERIEAVPASSVAGDQVDN